MTDVAVVVPNHLPHLDFLDEWGDELRDVPIIVVQDVGDKPTPPSGFDVRVVDHDDIADDLGSDAWIIPHRTAACRSYGYLLAHRLGVRYIATLDSDCYPDGSPWLAGHVGNLESRVMLDWVNSGPGPLYRGVPYGLRNTSPVYLSHGLWSCVPDLDGPTQLHYPDLRLSPATGTATMPRWNYFPMCSMNLAWRRELTPAFYFGLHNIDTYGVDRFDDIWAGVFAKRILDHLGWAAVSGAPSVEHRRQSNAFVNTRKEAGGLAMNENLWPIVRDIPLKGEDVAGCYAQLIDGLPEVVEGEPPGWTARFKHAAMIWLEYMS